MIKWWKQTLYLFIMYQPTGFLINILAELNVLEKQIHQLLFFISAWTTENTFVDWLFQLSLKFTKHKGCF